MSLLAPLVSLGLRQAVPGRDAEAADFVARLLAKPAGPLAAALRYAADRTWRGVGAALAAGRLAAAARAASGRSPRQRAAGSVKRRSWSSR